MTDQEPKSIIDPKYRGKLANDWVTSFIDGIVKEPVMKTVKVKDEEGNVTGEDQVPSSKSKVNLDNLFQLCRLNHIDPSKMEEQADRPNAPGRIRMTLGNSLRAAARKRHGLYDLNAEWCEADAEFIGDTERTELADGSKIKAPEPEGESA